MAIVVAVAVSAEHTFTKQSAASIRLIAGLGIEGDCHLGKTVQHRSRLHIQPAPGNLRQVHLLANETLLDHSLTPGEIGENITTLGIDLLCLARGTKLHFVAADMAEEDALASNHAIIVVTGLRNPCPQIEKHREGLQEVFIERDSQRKIVKRKAGVMSTVDTGGIVAPGMVIVVESPPQYEALGCV